MNLVALPIAIPLLAAGTIFVTSRRRKVRLWASGVAASALLGVTLALLLQVLRGGPHVLQVGGWPAPFGITLVADLTSGLLLATTATVGAAALLHGHFTLPKHLTGAAFDGFLHVLLAGLAGVFLAGDLFNLFVWLEVTVAAALGLLVWVGTRDRIGASLRYLGPNLVSSTLLFAGIGVTYGLAGSLNLADLPSRFADASPGAMLALALLILGALGIKAAAFPASLFVPATYPAPPSAVGALFAGLLTKAAFYAILRLTCLLFPVRGPVHDALLVVGLATLAVGFVAAMLATDVRRLLAWHLVGEVGILLVGLGLFTRTSLFGVVLFLVQVMVVKSVLFLVAGLAGRAGGERWELAELGGLRAASPPLAALFILPALSAAGVPPFVGFFGKLELVRAALTSRAWVAAAFLLLGGLASLVALLRIWNHAFWSPKPERGPPRPTERRLMIPAGMLVVLVVIFSLAIGPLANVADRAARHLLDPAGYVTAVLGGSR